MRTCVHINAIDADTGEAIVFRWRIWIEGNRLRDDGPFVLWRRSDGQAVVKRGVDKPGQM